MATFSSPMAATGSSMPIWGASRIRRFWRASWAPFPASSSMGCSPGWRAWRYLRAVKEFALLSGGDAANPRRSGMKSVFKIVPAAGLVLGLALAGGPAAAQQSAAPPAPTLKPATPACAAAAKEILQMKNAGAMYAQAVPNIVTQTKDQLMQTNLNYQKDLNEVAVIVAQKLAGREKEIGEGMAQIYCNEFTEKELTDLVAFYKSPLGQKL